MEKNMTEIITRRKNFEGKKYWLTTNSFKQGDKWFNCLYLHFAKDDYKNFNYPKLIERETIPGITRKYFNYFESDFAHLEWHCGCTFYEESFLIEYGKTYIKVGCDFQHLYDDAYMSADYGKEIISYNGDLLIQSFEKLISEKG